jgi:hypothetical protein
MTVASFVGLAEGAIKIEQLLIDVSPAVETDVDDDAFAVPVPIDFILETWK